jgi:hypothetical protein
MSKSKWNQLSDRSPKLDRLCVVTLDEEKQTVEGTRVCEFKENRFLVADAGQIVPLTDIWEFEHSEIYWKYL